MWNCNFPKPHHPLCTYVGILIFIPNFSGSFPQTADVWSQLLENSLLRTFISRGMYDICWPFLGSVPLHWLQPLPPTALLGLCPLPLPFMGPQFPMAGTTPFSTASTVAASFSFFWSTSLLLIHGFNILGGRFSEHPRSQIRSGVWQETGKTPFLCYGSR